MKKREVISLKLCFLLGIIIIGLVAAADKNNTTSPLGLDMHYSIQKVNFETDNNGVPVAVVYNDTDGQKSSYNKTFSNDKEARRWFQNVFSSFYNWWPSFF